WSGLIIVPYILLAYLFNGLYLNLNVASFFSNKIKYLIISSAAGCVSNLAFNFLLIPGYSMLGAAVSTLLSYMVMFFVLYYFSQKTYRIVYEWKLILRAAVVTFVLYAINIYIPQLLNLKYIYVLIIEFLSIFALFYALLGTKALELFKSFKVKKQLK
ncbi:MAG: polysaccharide biosynthesis C-terminal domain-containing protein, partial [Ignavibacteria bacterium]|nr:polysaccharide biosynthesis C-terminal domain-containing protein [Ignavibacteria bacterium]